MKRPEELANAIALAAQMHGSQVDKGGVPYIIHPIHVMNQMDTIEEKIVAVLHDVLEDTPLSYNALRKEVGVSASKAIHLLSKPPTIDYFDYIESIIEWEKENGYYTASKVKMADLRHNLDPLRQPSLKEKDLLRLQKYHRAYKMLREHREKVGL